MSDRSSEQSKAAEVAEQQSDNLMHALSGAGGGLLSMALTYPLMTLSTRAQVEKKKAKTSTLAAAKRIIDREGVAGLYAGMESALFGITITNFVYYYWYEFSRAFFQRTTKKSYLTTAESMAAGALAGSATVFLTNPIWVVNTRMTAREEAAEDDAAEKGEAGGQKPSRPTTLGTLMKIIREDGPMRLFAGVLPALILVANPIIQYTVFERLKELVGRRKKVTAVDSFLLGAAGKLAATTITYPYITVKSKAHVATGSGKQDGMITTLRKTVSEEGVTGLYAGIAPKLTQSVITAAFLFAFKDMLYEMTVKARKKVIDKA